MVALMHLLILVIYLYSTVQRIHDRSSSNIRQIGSKGREVAHEGRDAE